MEINGYQSRVHITQVVPCIKDEFIIDPETKFNHLINTSWLYDPFGDHSTYGVEFKVNRDFSWEFFMWAEYIEEVKEVGYTLLMSLQERFKGLDGQISVFPLFSKYLEIERPLYEIIIPSNPPIKLQLLRKLITYYKAPRRKIDMNLFILWKRDDLHNLPRPNHYMIKIFVSLSPNQENSMEFSKQESTLRAVLRYLISGMSIPPYMKADYKLLPSHKWKDLLMCDVFPKKSKYGIDTGSSIPVELLPKYIEPNKIDFYIPQDMPLPKPPILENRNLINLPISKDDRSHVYFGNKLIDGVLSNEIGIIEIDSFNSHLNIFGKTGTGKSTLIKIIINELCNKRPDVGILILNLVKPDVKKDFPMAVVCKFPSKRFKVPYIIFGNRVKKSISGTSNVLAACLGLKYLGPVIISETFQRCYTEFGEFPSQITEFFNCVEENIKAKPYDPDTQKTILTAFRRRIDEFFTNPELEKTLRLYTENSKNVPEWFLKWRRGDVVLIDLTDLDNKEQHLVTMLIFQMIDILIPFDSSNKLKHLIVIDEAHRVVGKSRDNDPESAEFIMKNRINALFSNTIEECRSKGLGIIISDVNPYRLLDSAIDSAGIKILFRLGYPSNEIFTGNVKEREMLLNLEDRYALVLNGTNGERYLNRITDDRDSKNVSIDL